MQNIRSVVDILRRNPQRWFPIILRMGVTLTAGCWIQFCTIWQKWYASIITTIYPSCILLRDMTPCLLVISCQSIRRHMKTIFICIALKILNNALTCFSWIFLGRYSWLNIWIGWRTQRVFAVMWWWNQLRGSEGKIALRFILGKCLSWLVFSDCVSLLISVEVQVWWMKVWVLTA
jgi:hypothetical protein